MVDNSWGDVSGQSDPTLWILLSNGDIDVSNLKYETDSEEEIDGNYAK